MLEGMLRILPSADLSLSLTASIRLGETSSSLLIFRVVSRHKYPLMLVALLLVLLYQHINVASVFALTGRKYTFGGN